MDRLDDAVASIRYQPTGWKLRRCTPLPRMSFAAWEDGYVVSTENGTSESDTNFVVGNISLDSFETARSKLAEFGAFADETLGHVRCGIDCPYEIRQFKYRDQVLDMRGQDYWIWNGIKVDERNLSHLTDLSSNDLRYLFAWIMLKLTIFSLRPLFNVPILGKLGYCRLDTIWIPQIGESSDVHPALDQSF